MSYIPFTLAAYFLNCIAVLTDKFLLATKIPNPLVYVFYFSAFSMVVIPILPFTALPTFEVFSLASLSTLLWTTGAYFMFKSLQIGQASRVIPIIGTLIPVFLLLQALATQSITGNEVLAVVLLVLGLFSLTANTWRGKMDRRELIFEVASALLFAVSYLVLREAYLQESFLTVLVWSRVILIPVGIVILVMPALRKIVLSKNGPKINFLSKTGLLFLGSQVAGGGAELLLTYSVSLATPALVNSLQGVQYVFLFIAALVLGRRNPKIFRENGSFYVLAVKVVGILLVGLGLFVLSSGSMFYRESKLGVTYSPKYAKSLGLDPEQTYIRMLDELNIKRLRLPVYWDEVEEPTGVYNFSGTDFYLKEAEKRDVEIILVLGYKQPRWPECFAPYWVKNLSRNERENKILELLEAEVEHFKNSRPIKYWQVENEPIVEFGLCDKPDFQTYEFFKKEVAFVKTKDSRPVILTDSGELSSWQKIASVADIFGTTVYRNVWNPWLGRVYYPLPPIYYQVKAQIAKKLANPNLRSIIVSELQTETWTVNQKPITEIPVEAQVETFSPNQIGSNVQYAREMGFDEVYLWGVEWWYYLASYGHPEYIEAAKVIFSDFY